MIDSQKIEAAAHKWAMANKKRFPKIVIAAFMSGVLWTIIEMEKNDQDNAIKCRKCGSTDLFLFHTGGKCNDCGASV